MAIVAIGPLSNVTAPLTMHPGERKKIRRIVLMGGSIAHGYYPNSEPTAEYNIAADAKASRVVFTSGVPIGLTSMEGLVQPLQTALSSDNQLWAPLLLRNNTGAAENIAIHSDLPAGWSGETADRIYPVAAGGEYPAQLFYTAPSGPGQQSPQTLTWTATVKGKPIGAVHLAVYLEMDGVPQ